MCLILSIVIEDGDDGQTIFHVLSQYPNLGVIELYVDIAIVEGADLPNFSDAHHPT